MKKLVLIGVFFSTMLGAQVNDYFVNNPSWVCFHEADPWPCVMEDSLNYYVNGDSIINAMTYKVLYTRGRFIEFSQGPPMCPLQNYTYQDTVPTGFLRSQGMQMYFIPNEDSVEYLLYDFNLTVGSHLPLTYVNTDTTYIVTSIDSIYTAAGYRQRYFLNGNNFEYLIEGVGSSSGLFYPLGLLFEQYASLICYSQNDTAWFPSQGPACDVMTVVSMQSQQKISLLLSPNPSTNYVDIALTGAVMQSVVVYDVFGKAVRQQADEPKLFVGDLAPGIYLVQVHSASGRFTRELLVE